MIRILFVCHGSILKSPGKACKINDFRPHSHVDIQVETEAFKHFITRADKNIPILSEYAKILKVEARLRSYHFKRLAELVRELKEKEKRKINREYLVRQWGSTIRVLPVAVFLAENLQIGNIIH